MSPEYREKPVQLSFVPSPEPPQPGLHDLAILLLDQAVQASYTLSQLRALAEQHPHGDTTAHAQITDAITAITHARTTLISDANRLTEQTRAPQRLNPDTPTRPGT